MWTSVRRGNKKHNAIGSFVHNKILITPLSTSVGKGYEKRAKEEAEHVQTRHLLVS